MAGRQLTGALGRFSLALGIALGLAAATEGAQKGHMQLSSTAFSEGPSIPSKYTCDGENVSPPLTWSGVPAGAKSFALIADDPDAPVGTWVHWVVKRK